jgi:DNA processing protein
MGHQVPAMEAVSTATNRLFELSHLRGVGPAQLNAWASRPDFATLSLDSLAARTPALQKALELPDALEEAREQAYRAVAAAQRDGARIISPIDPDYPQALGLTRDRPAFLFLKGELGPTREKAMAVIGTREPTEHGKIIATRITRYFAERSWSIVSGLALGVDGLAHQAALDAHGHTVAVLAHGLDTVAPKSHTKLAADILDRGGALVSEYPYGTRPYGPNFVKRDRIQAGLAAGLVLVQTDVKGGSLHATRSALAYGRVVAYPVPTPRDISNREPKIEGILKIHHGQHHEVAQYLHCSADALSRIRALTSREDYPAFERLASERLDILYASTNTFFEVAAQDRSVA